jgi:integrase
MFNYAIEEGLIESNPAARLGRFTRLAKTAETKGIALTAKEVQQFLEAAKEIYPYYHALFLTAVRAGLRRGELHDLRHTFGSLLLQNGASIVYLKDQMGHSSVQVTVDIYGHLIPGASLSFVDRLDDLLPEPAETNPQQSARPAQPGKMEIPPDLVQD